MPYSGVLMNVRSIKIHPVNNNVEKHDANIDTVVDIDPFSHETKLSCLQWVKIFIMSVTIAPIRFVCLMIIIVVAGILSWIALLGVSEEELVTKPLGGWRRKLQKCLLMIGRAGFFCVGVHRIKVKGKKADRGEAPVIIGVPHATILDPVAILFSNAVPIVKNVVKEYFLLGTVGKFQQALFVNRSEADARQNVREQIKARASDVTENENGSSWRQLFIFPEGTTTNGKAVIKFKSGAFESGLPVQVVLLRHNNRPDTITWTWNQKPNNSWTLLWRTMCQLQTNFEIEYLPPYIPSLEEADDPRMYAQNVRKIVSENLKVPTSEKRVEDVLLSNIV